MRLLNGTYVCLTHIHGTVSPNGVMGMFLFHAQQLSLNNPITDNSAMQSDVKIAIVAPVMGFLFVAIYYLMVGLNRLNSEYGFLSDTGSLSIPILVCGVSLLVVAFVSMFKFHMIGGMTFFMAGIAALYVYNADVVAISDVFRLVVAMVSLVLVYMSYRVRDFRLMIFNTLMVIAFIAAMNTLDYDHQNLIVASVLMIGGIVALAAAVSEWIYLQDVMIDCGDDFMDFSDDREES